MTDFTPTLTIAKTTENTKSFISENTSVFWQIIRPLLPFILGFTALDMALMFANKGELSFLPGEFLTSYIHALLCISCYRVVIDGPRNYRPAPVNPLLLSAHEKTYVILTYAIIGFMMVLDFVFSAEKTESLTSIMLVTGIMLSIIILFYKISFYFAALAVERPITVNQSFAMTKGYFWRMTFSVFLLSIPLILIRIGTLALMMFEKSILSVILALLVSDAIIYPLLSILTSIVMANYYLYALQKQGHTYDPG